MAKIREILDVPKQRLSKRALRKGVVEEYADDPAVQFFDYIPSDEDAPHGVNHPEATRCTGEI